MSAPNAMVLASDTGISYSLDDFPEDSFNRVVPTQAITMPGDLVRPFVQVVQLDPDPRHGVDVWTSKDLGDKVALTRIALRKLATAAAVSIIDSRRTDDGSDPDVVEYTAVAEMTLPTGQRIRATGTKRVDLGAQSWASPAQRNRYRSAFAEHVASRAENRAIRSILSIKGAYAPSEVRKPFAAVTYAPNMDHPEIRAALIAAMTGTVAGAFGPQGVAQVASGPAPQLPAGDIVEVPATDDEPIEAEFSDEPDWGIGAPAPAATDLGARLRAVLEANASRTEPATDEQKGRLRELLAGLNTEQVQRVLDAVFGYRDLRATQVRHAQAVIEVGTAMGAERLRTAWAELAADTGRLGVEALARGES